MEQNALQERHVVEQRQISVYHQTAQKLGENAILQRDLEQKLKAVAVRR